MSDEKYVFIHILWRSPAIFSPRFIELINNNDCFEKSEHLLVCTNESLYEKFKHYDNVVFYKCKKNYSAEVINHFAPMCEHLIVHSLCPPFEFFKVKKKYVQKIFVRTWGSDIGGTYYSGQPFKNIVKSIISFALKDKYKKLAGIGVANRIDSIKINDYFEYNKFFFSPYSAPDSKKNDEKELTCKIEYSSDEIKNMISEMNTDKLKILLGHSAMYDSHFEMIDKLCPYKDKDFLVYFPLGYGNAAGEIKKYAAEKLGDKCVFIDKLLNFDEYKELISKIDVCILNGISSYALGNISILVKNFKKVYLNPKGLLYRFFEFEKLPCGKTSDIGKISFDEFSKPYTESDFDKDSCLFSNITFDVKVKQWYEIFEFLKGNIQITDTMYYKKYYAE